MPADQEITRTVNLSLGNAAEQNVVVINAAHIAYVRLNGAISSSQRKMEIHMVSGNVIGMGFDDVDLAEEVFSEVIGTINRTIPDHVRGTTLHIPQNELL